MSDFALATQLEVFAVEKKTMRTTSRLLVSLSLLAASLGVPTLAVAGRPRALEGVVNVNTAHEDELRLLPGIGPAKARSILTYRQAHPFRTVEELVRIKGIGRKMVKALRAHLTVNGPTTAHPVAAPAAPVNGATAAPVAPANGSAKAPAAAMTTASASGPVPAIKAER